MGHASYVLHTLYAREWRIMTLREKAVNVGLGVPVFVPVAGVAEETIVAESFQIAVFDAEKGHQGFVVVDARCSDGGNTVFLAF